ncbi:hypothetical protein V6380_16875 [Acinetobacter variabilis]|uniref:hypothetical protein n=1 Tax=Acinetobacter variabilis TaxID=70346 RepID=UPI003B83C6EA
MTTMPSCNRHFFALYYPDGFDHANKYAIPDVITFTCLITRENWVELMNKNSSRLGKPPLATKAKSSEVRKLLYFSKGDSFSFKPVTPESCAFLPELSDKTYYLTDVNRSL